MSTHRPNESKHPNFPKDSVLSELLAAAKELKEEKTDPLDRSTETTPPVQIVQKRGRWDDSSDSEEEKKKKKKDRKRKKVVPEQPLVTVAMPGSVNAVDDYYASHPLLELPPEESVPVSSQDEKMETPEPILSPPLIEPVIHMCRSVNKYRKIARLNEGSYGIVYKAQNIETNEVIALKRIKFNENVVLQEAFPVTALREINIMQDLSHPNILNVQEMVIGDNINEVYMVMDYIPYELGRVLHTIKADLTASEVKTLLYQLLSGLDYMHRKWYFHRDLKSSNLLYKDGELKICDFGMARRFSNPLSQYTQHVVTLIYRAPELLLNPQEDVRYPPSRKILYDSKVDMWSAGCLFYEFITRQTLVQLKEGEGEFDVLMKLFRVLGYPGDDCPVFKDSPYKSSFGNCQQYYCKLREIIPSAPLLGMRYLTNNGLDLMLKLLAFDPDQRISAEDALKHPYFRENPPMKKPDEMPVFDERFNERGL
ncbi:CDK kinase [Blastocystis sp. subtype 4]|uniref:CDK kinase n=1 Tax=Blastocystis sp. subtype 4 TaxID=944170 RepID=UPI000711A1DD|nr:CDK kinase [Blastocystis sp. subtype 4]KNB43169.1 CDK kinase [Blastocystis sp. subtype 4]|eukprot:XP_014526612.1 CDK kinase [Blastocystis sp. subtype 4]